MRASLTSKFLASAMAFLTAVQPALPVEVPYFRLRTTAAPALGTKPPSAGTDTVPGIGSLTLYGPVQVRARIGVPFNLQVIAGNPEGDVAWSASGNSLPAGLALTRDGWIRGTPTAIGSAAGILIGARDAAGKTGSTQGFTIDVRPVPGVATLPTYARAAGRTLEIVPVTAETYGTQTWTLSRNGGGQSLPVGLSVDALTGRISGTADQKGTFDGLVLSVTDADGATGRSGPFSITVDSTLSIEGYQSAYPARAGRRLAAIRPYVTGADGVPYWSVSGYGAPLPGGLTVDPGTGSVGGIPSMVGTFPGVALRVTDSADGDAVSSAPATFKVEAMPTMALAPVYHLRGIRSGTVAHDVAPTASGLLNGGRWYVDGDLPPTGKMDQDTGKITFTMGNGQAAYPIAMKVIDLFDGATAKADTTLDLLPELAILGPMQSLTPEVGWPFSFTPSATGVVGTPTWSVVGPLPPGIGIEPSTGVISGTATALMDRAPLVLQVTDDRDGHTARANHSIAGVALADLAVMPMGDATIQVYGRGAVFASANGVHGTPTWALSGPVRPWMRFRPADGVIEIEPDEVGVFGPFTLSVTDATLRTAPSAPFSIVVRPPPFEVRFNPLSGRMNVRYDSGAPEPRNQVGEVSYVLSSEPLPAGLRFDSASGRIVGTPTASGAFGPYTLTASDASGVPATTSFGLSVDPPVPPPGQPARSVAMSDVTATVNASTTATPTATGFEPGTWTAAGGTPLPAWARLDPATGALTVTATAPTVSEGHRITGSDATGGTASNPFSITVTAAPGLKVVNNAVPDAILGRDYSAYPARVVGDPPGLTWYNGGQPLPAGLGLDAFTGEVRGRPSALGDFAGLRLRAVNAADVDGVSGDYAIKVKRPPAGFTVSMAGPPEGVVGTSYGPVSATATPPVGGLLWSLSGSLPAGLSFSQATGTIDGTPTAEGTSGELIVSADARDGTEPASTSPFTIKVRKPTPPVVASLKYPAVAGVKGEELAAVAPTLAGYPGTVTYAAPASFPAGLSVDPATGAITGTPTAATSMPGLVVTASNGTAALASDPFAIVIALPPLTVTTDAAKRWFVGVAGTQSATVTGEQSAPAFALLKGEDDVSASLGGLVPGLSFSTATGAISGTPSGPALVEGLRIVATDPTVPRSQATTPFSLAVSSSSLAVSGMQSAYDVEYRTALAGPAPTATANGSLTWSVAEGVLPGWARLNADGSVTGTPGSPGDIGETTGLRLKVVDSGAPFPAYSDPFSIKVKRPTLAATSPTGTFRTYRGEALPTIPAPVATGVVGTASWSFGGGVPGVTFAPASRSFSGMPSEKGEFDGLTLTVRDSFDGRTAPTTFKLVVIERPTSLTLGTDKTAYTVRVGAPFALTASVEDETGAVTWSRPEGAPAWMEFDASTGGITGTPDATGVHPGLVIKAVDSVGLKGETGAFSVTVATGLGIEGLRDEYAGRAGLAYAAIAPRVTNAVGTVTWSATGLPAGLSISPATGAVTGRATEPGTFQVAFKAVDASDGAAAVRTVTLSVERPLQVVSNPAAYVARTGKPYVSVLPGIVGARGRVTWAVVGTLPGWAAPDASTGGISGMAPSTIGETPGLRLRATDSWDNASVDGDAFTLSVMEAFAVVGMPTQFSAHYDFALGTKPPSTRNAAGAVAYAWGLGNPPAWAQLDPATGSITGVPDAVADTGGLTLLATDASGATAHSVPFSINVYAQAVVTLDTAAGAAFQKRVNDDIAVTATGQGLIGAGTYSLVTVTGTAPAGLKADPATGKVTGPFTGPGNGTFKVRVVDSTGAPADSPSFSVRVVPALGVSGLQPLYGTRINGFIGTDSPVVTGAQGAITYSLGIAPPEGLSFDAPATRGVLKGIPTKGGTYPATKLTVKDGYDNRTAETAFDLKILGSLAVSGVRNVAVRNGSDIAAVSFLPTADNVISATGPAWTAARNVVLPTGVRVDPATGGLAGTPTGYSASTTVPNLKISATDVDDMKSDSAAFTVTVHPTLTAALTAGPYSTRVGVATTLPAASATGRIGTLSWRIVTTAGTAPASAAVSGDGVVTFTADAQSIGTWSFVVEATDSDGTKAQSATPVTVTVVDVAKIQMADISVRVTGSRSATPTVGGNLGPVTWSATGLPAYASIDPSSGKVTATPPLGTSPGTVPVTLLATESDGGVGRKSVNLVIGQQPSLRYNGDVSTSYFYLRKGEPYTGTAPTFTTALGTVRYSVAQVPGGGCVADAPVGVTVSTASGIVSGYVDATPPVAINAGPYCFQGVDDYDGAIGFIARTANYVAPLTMTNMPRDVGMTPNLAYNLVGTVKGSLGYNETLSITGSGTLPPGISFEAVNDAQGRSNSFAFTGTPTSSFTAPVTYVVTARDRIDDAQLAYSVTFTPRAPFTVTMASLAVRETGVVNLVPGTSGGTAPYTWAISSGQLPAGVTLDAATGKVTGRMPRQSATAYKLRGTDSAGRQGEATFTLTGNVNNLASAAAGSYYFVHQDTPRTAQATATGLLGTASYSLDPPEGVAFPARSETWMSMARSGALTFSPSTAVPASSSFGYIYFATDSADGAYVRVSEQVYTKYKFVGTLGTGPNTSPMRPVLPANSQAAVGPFYPSDLIGNGQYQVVMSSGADPGFRFFLPYSNGGQAYLSTPNTEGTYTFSIRITDSGDGATALMGPYTTEVRKLTLSYPAAFEVRRDAALPMSGFRPTVGGRIDPASKLTFAVTTQDYSWNIDPDTGTFNFTNNQAVGSTGTFTIRVGEANGGTATYTGTVRTTAGPTLAYPVGTSTRPAYARVGKPIADFGTPTTTNPGSAGTLAFSVLSTLPPELRFDPATARISAVGTCAAPASSSPLVKATDSLDGAGPTVAFVYRCVSPLVPKGTTTSPKVGTTWGEYLSADNVQGTATFAATGLPPGLTVSSNGLVLGKVAAGGEGTYRVSMTVTDSADQSSESLDFDMVVTP